MNNYLTKKQINDSLKKLRERVSEIAMCTNIIDPFYNNFEINKKTASFAMIMNEFTRHIIGQLITLIFDRSDKYQLASLSQIGDEIYKYAQHEETGGKRHDKLFNEAHERLENLRYKHYKTLKEFRDKSYAHLEIKNIQDDSAALEITWEKVLELTKNTKEILNSFLLYWNDEETDFAESQYEEYRCSFWRMINHTEIN